ncbi:MAG TPA: ATP-dependent protease ATPase subunit HslU [Candidatus Cloacimonadota bacterium]|nr:ATP-dependent protease ATPase subunit HslU [Candidatus Cloacimonadota bacterium]HOV15938.1 ATP-dependent protease ATPase subunit HslU [Candidatus Cloacimonadota bacterium]HQL14267.1 ATP-dependent protease ATPase subunit HslU [Candidatus Cloacimonadota bacterium]
MKTEIAKLTPSKIVAELDKYIIGQDNAKRAVAIALRNRWRRQQVEGELQEEIIPNNIILIGPTGVGKTEIARRLSHLANAPFIKVEASKFTEVGYVGRDVESMVRELMNVSVNQVRNQMLDEVREQAHLNAIERVLDLILPPKPNGRNKMPIEEELTQEQRYQRSRDKMRQLLLDGKLDGREVEIKNDESHGPGIEVLSNLSLEMLDMNIGEMFANIIPGKNKERSRRMKVSEALKYLEETEASRLVNQEKVVERATDLVENNGIIFIDELDKIANSDKHSGIDVSRSGVQRDLLPIVEGSNVPTKYGMIDTSHILFIAAGAFHTAKPSDLIPELQGRFPIRVELNSLSQADFERILTEPENALTKQYIALFKAEKSKLIFTPKAISEIAKYAALANEKMEDIGARRLHTILNALLDEYMFELPNQKYKTITIDADMVTSRLKPLIESEDLSRFIL